MTAPLPHDETTRLQALADYEALGTGLEPAFDRLAALAARLFRVPIVLVTLVGRDRQWIKGRHGSDLCDTSRDASFCAHALLQPPGGGAFVVTDAARDPRFADNPLVTGDPHVRFYAGVPLRDPGGQPLGAFCLLDTVPRTLSPEAAATLDDLAAAAAGVLELRLANLRRKEEAAERQWVESALRRSESRFRRMAANTPGMVYQFVLAPDGAFHFPFVSEGCREFYGVEPQAVYDRPALVLDVLDAPEQESFMGTVARSAETLDPWQWEGRYRAPDGTLRWAQGISRPERLPDGKTLWNGMLFDVTARKHAEEAQRAAKAEAERANVAKSDFLSRMSHELRTPLNAILGFGQLLELGSLEKREAASVGHILKAGRHLLSLIDEVLAISRIEAGRMNLSLEPVSVAETVRECLGLVSRQAADRGVQCEDGCGAAGRYVVADRQRLRQVLLNLLSNAVKYNREAGRVALHSREVPAAGGQPARLRLEVTDTGEGLTAGQIARLFRPFERLEAERTLTEGTGLGLALSKGLVEAMRGRIGVDSTPGVGSTFWVELPLSADPLARPQLVGGAPEANPGEGCEGTVLYIEDNLSNLRLIEMLLTSLPGLQLLSAQQGTLGLEMARARRPDLVLLDLHLPDLPGWDVLARLQADPATRPIPVVIISADATAHQAERLMKAGARNYLTKPIDVPALMRVLGEHLKPPAAGQ